LFFQASTTGEPLVNPLWKEFPMDPMLFGIDDEFMFGDKILVSPKRGDPAEPVLQKTIENSIRLLKADEKLTQIKNE
jgi:hypothetical protein